MNSLRHRREDDWDSWEEEVAVLDDELLCPVIDGDFGPAVPSQEELLLEYLRSLPDRQLTQAATSSAAEKFWMKLRTTYGEIPAPNVSPMEDEEGLRLSWLARGRYLEVEVAPDETYEWFYRNTDASTSDFGDGDVSDELQANFLAHFRDIF